jgi:hypothetical protein
MSDGPQNQRATGPENRAASIRVQSATDAGLVLGAQVTEIQREIPR